MLIRTLAPDFSTNFKVNLEPLSAEKLNQWSDIYYLKSDNIEVFRLEIVFAIGLLNAPDLETGSFLARLMALGTANKSGLEIAESFERLGGFLDIAMGNHRTTVTLHGMSNYFHQYIPLLLEVIFEADFPQSEIDLQITQASQSYQINAKKTSYLANKGFKAAMYGTESILGQSLDLESIKKLNRDTLINFHQERLLKSPFDIFICGKFTTEDLNFLKSKFTPFLSTGSKQSFSFPEIQSTVQHTEEIEESVQSTLILGKRLFSRNHADFHKFLVTNTILGGYFGSRLMKNIREEKGLTYGISSSLVSNGIDGVFSIKADLNKEKLEEAQNEIYKEITILKTEPVGSAELETVKNYIKGNILSNTNTIFDIMDKHKAIYFEKLPADFYESMGDKVEAVTPDDIMNMANQYLNQFSTIIAG